MTETTDTPPPKKRTFGCLSYALAGFLLFIMTFVIGFILPFDFLFNLFFGWGLFLWKTIPRITVSLPGVATFFVVLTLLTTGIHFAGRRWYRLRASVSETTSLRRWQLKRTVQIIFSIVLLFASGIAIVGVAHQGVWLITSKKRWIKYDGVGEGARRSACKNNMKQIGLALHNYHNIFHTFPPGGIFDETGRPMHSWATIILPFLDRTPLYRQIDFSQPWNAPENAKPFQEFLPTLTCPNAMHAERNSLGQAIISYAGNSRIFSVNQGNRIKDITDGTSNTLLAGEVNSHFKPWGDPVNFRDPALGINDKKKNSFGSRHVGGAHFLFADGRVRFLSENIDPATLKALSTPSKGDVVKEY